MAKKVYNSDYISLIDGTEIYITPLKVKYLRLFMDAFYDVKNAVDDIDAMYRLAKCVAISMNQYYPQLNTTDAVADNMDLYAMYRVLEVAADISVKDKESGAKEATTEAASTSWDSFDLPKLESELFLLGIWKDYEDLESSLSMPEILITLSAKRDLDYNEKKFLASIQGINLDEASGQSQEEDVWEKIKARANARINGGDPEKARVADPNDISSFVGAKAQQVGFGIGMGIEYSTM